MLLATVSHAPYCRGGVLQATGDRTATLLLGIVMLVKGPLLHASQNLIEWNGSEARGVIGQAIRDDQLALVEESAASINDVGKISFPFVLIRLEQGLAKTADNLAGIIAIQQKRANAVLSHWADAMAEHQPACIGFNGGSTVPNLDQFPRKRRFKDHPALIPEVDVVGKHEVDVLIVLAGEHGIEAIDFPGEDGHAFVLGGRTIKGNESKEEEVRSLHQLWQDHLAIEGREGGVVDVGAVIVLETDEPGVFDAVALRRRGRENDAFRQPLLRLKLDLIIGPGQHQNSPDGVPIRQAGLLHFGFEIGAQFFQCKRLPKLVHNPACESAGQSQLKEFPLEERLLVTGVRDLTRLGEEAGWG